MIILIHNHSNIVNIIIDEECDISNYIGKAIVKTLFSLSKRYPKKKIGWIHHSLVQTVDFTSWSKLLKHPLELLTYEPSQKHYMSSDIEYIDFFSPFVRFNQMKGNRYLTWMSSSAMGCTYTDLIQKFSPFKDINNFPFFLLVISKIGNMQGIVQSSYVKETFFDKALEFGYGEDADYGNSLRKKGCNITYISQNPMLHLKAPIGDFRFKFQPIWSKEKPLPKPSPTIMYNLIKNSTKKQIKGYKLFLFYKIFFNKKPFRIIHFYKKFNQQWNKSLYWAKKLKEKQK